MDRPHSSRSQFNKRTPKSGPSPLSRSTTTEKDIPKMTAKKPEPGKRPASTFGTIRRPIATNSRIRQGDSIKKEMYLTFVTNALQQKLQGTTESFEELVGEFNISQQSQREDSSESPIDTSQIRLLLIALSHVVSRLERIHSTLVEAIVNMPWTMFDNPTVKSYTVFIGMLLSAKPEYLSLVLAKIAQGFTYQTVSITLSIPSSSSSPPLTHRTISERLHYLLRHLLTLIPTLPRTLQPLLIKHFPHKRQNQLAQVTYIKNLLKVSSYCPELSEKILGVIVDRAIQIDVEIQVEFEELEDQAAENSESLFDVDPFDIILGQEPSSSSSEVDSDSDDEDNQADTFSDISSDAGDLDVDFDDTKKRHQEIPTNMKHVSEMVKKLDSILFLVFEHFDETRRRCGPVQSHDRAEKTGEGGVKPWELPPLPPLEMSFSSSLASPLTPFGRSPSVESFPFDLNPVFIPPTPPIPQTPSTSTILSRETTSTPQAQSSTSTPQITKSSKSSRQTLRNQFHSLVAIFDRTILRTFKSRYTQFLLFWYASVDPEFSDVVMGMLVERALMGTPSPFIPNTEEGLDGDSATRQKQHRTMAPEVTRSVAASYIGSFVSRANFVDRDATRSVVGVLCEYLKAHLDDVEEAARVGGSSEALGGGTQHMIFDAVVQALLLIFCFRWRDLVGSSPSEEQETDDAFTSTFDPTALPNDDIQAHSHQQPSSWIPELAVLKRSVFSILNPLSACSPNVVMQFARVANVTGFMYCYPILGDEMKKGHAPSSREEGGDRSLPHKRVNAVRVVEELNTFFPFDPYRLPKSGVFIEGVYREWNSVALEDDEDDEDEDDEGEDPVGEGHLSIERSKKAGDDGGLGVSLGVMSISPRPDAPIRDSGLPMSLC